MKKMITTILFLMLTLLFIGCGKADTSEVEIDYGTSSLYSKEDMDAAIKVIRKQFRSFEGCELHSLSYISDESSWLSVGSSQFHIDSGITICY